MTTRTGIIVIGVATLGASAFGLPIDSRVATRTIHGRVIDAATGKAIGNLPIVVSGASVGSATNAGGVFSIANVPDDATTIQFRHPCYFAVQVSIPPKGDVEIDIGLPFDVSSRQRAGCGGLGGR